MENVGKQSPHRFEEKLTCFNEFKSVVERIVSQRSCIIWSVHGGLTSVITAADLIFKHGNKSHTGVLGPVVDYWLFVRGLRWLEPTLAPDIDYLSKLPAASPGKPQFNKVKPISRPRVHFTHGQQWLEKSFKDQSLSRQFKVLLSNKSHLSEHYHDWAYLSDNTFASATLVCIRALEQNSSTLLARIPTPLLGRRRTTKQNSNPRLHRAVTSTSDITTTQTPEKIDENLPRSESDPINAAVESRTIPSNGILAERAEVMQSVNPNLSEDPLGNSPVVMGMMTSLPGCVGGNEWVSKDKEELRQKLLSPCKKKLSFDAAEDRKPLFCDSGESDCEPDDLGFLTSDISPDKTSAKTYYVTMESSIPHNLINTFTTRKLSLIPEASNSASEFKDRRSLNLPDIVTSTESARTDYLDVKEKFGENGNNSTRILQIEEHGPINEKSSCETEKNANSCQFKLPQVKVAQKFTHRRSKSEQIKGVKVIDEADNNLANCDDLNEVANVRIKPSSSLPSLNESPDVCYNDIVPTKAQPKSQSLMSYLRNQDLATCADIDKENAHFDFSDMLIGAIEQMKCKMRDHQTLNKTAGSSMLASRTSTPSLRLPVDETGSSYSHLGDGLMTPRSQFSISESYQSPVGSFLSDPYPQHLAFSAADLPLRTDQTFKSGVDFCDAESTITTMTGRKSVAESFRTAESIAIGLLQTFSDQRHVTEREVDWLISEDDVPQKLLPLPRSTAVDPDQGLDAGIRIRGNQTWAPPRPQIILKAPIKLKVKQAMIKQNFLCAGCGSRVEKSQSSSSEDIFRFFSDLSALILTVTPVRNIIMFSCYTDYMKRFRYCEYTGKYFCTCCHDNKLFIIPAYILHKFDFNKYKVCNFSYDWLNKINCEPLFNINDVNPGLYRKSKVMASIKGLRVQLLSLYKYLQTCHFAKADDNSGNLFEEVQSHFLPHFFEEDPHIYSLDDFMSLKSGQLLDDLKKTVDLASEHVVSCQSCRMKGFICEFCGCEEIIFPHQPSTSTCPLCNACFHKKCYVSSACPRCTRLVKRKQMLQKISEE
ncbi:run domain Beclin-1-interacting and cysteine-rich domain-containing protein-like isoform X3 [Clavelina lepadiformis]|uniref:run domain Beclin-1-interacting and cysteine-rich domain-containing protein-like isoform X3 n=1 Tax=Clavelina lepadiformis TaxID=159417 RepID=UPI004042DC1D